MRDSRCFNSDPVNQLITSAGYRPFSGLRGYSVFIPGGKYGATLYLFYGDVYLYFFTE